MPKLVISIDSVVIKDVELVKQRTTLGRRPYNDIVIDNLAVSGEHAAVHMENHVVEIEDLRSTNGTYVNGKSVVRQELRHGDTMDVGKYKIRFYSEPVELFEQTMFFRPDSLHAGAAVPLSPADAGQPPSSAHAALHQGIAALPAVPIAIPVSAESAAPPTSSAASTARIRYLSGITAGRELSLSKVVTTLGRPGVAVASITHRRNAFVLVHVEGTEALTVNGVAIGGEAVTLQDGDVVVLAGTQMQFVLQ